MQNPPKDDRWLQRTLADLGRRLRTLETTPRTVGNLAVGGNLTVTGNLSVTGLGQRQYVEVGLSQGVTNNITLQNCTDLVLPLVSAAKYEGEAVLFYTATLGNDFDYAWTVPVGSAGIRGTLCPDITSAAGNVVVLNDRVSSSFTQRFSAGGSGGTFRQIREKFVITAGADGNLQLQFAERVAAAATTATVLIGSYIKLERVA